MALLGTGWTVTYAKLAADTRRIIVALLQAGLPSGRTVAVDQPDPYRNLLLSLGLDYLGLAIFLVPSGMATAMPLSIDLVLTAVAAKASARATVLCDLPRSILLHEEWWQDAFSAPDVSPPLRNGAPDPDAPFMLLRSSGTSGIPKTMLVSRAAMQIRIKQRQRILRLGRHSSYLITMPLNVAGIFYAVTACLRLGATVVQPAGPPSWRDLAVGRATHATLLPIHLRRLLAAMPDGVPSRPELTLCVIGARLPGALRQEALDRLCGTIHGVYSSNEVGTISTICPDGAGNVVPGLAVRIADAAGQAVPAGAVGLVKVRSAGMARPHRQDHQGLSTLAAGWFETGDLGSIRADGRLFLFGRCDDVVNLGGVKRSCEDVEDAILRRLDFHDVGVFTVEDAIIGQVLVVCAVTSTPVNAAMAVDACSIMSGGPVSLIFLDRLPRTEHGKLQRHRLRDCWSGAGLG